MRRLTHVSVVGLLGRFNHNIDIDDQWEFVILHGPNGVGKTRLLEIIVAAFGPRPHALLDLPFERVHFRFTDDSLLQIVRLLADQDVLPGLDDAPLNPNKAASLRYSLHLPGGESVDWTYSRSGDITLSPRRMRDVERYLPVDQVGPDVWLDLRIGDHVTFGELIARYGHELPFETGPPPELPDALRAFLADQDVHLIETDRLLRLDSRAIRSTQPRRPPQRATVLEFADDLTQRIGAALARNSRTSQELDRTFPLRLLNRELPPRVSDSELQERYERQSELRRRLADIAVLDPSAEIPLPERELADWERRVLWIYLDDSEQKLSTFQTLLDRVRLLREIVNDRFLFKTLHIDAESGFRFITDEGLEISAAQLSSGEQHELVLLYDLLFNVTPNSLVLVDEPEISLHVRWQQEFLNDIQRIAALTDLRFIVATHSPQIIHTWWDRAFALYRGPDAIVQTDA